MFIYFTVAPVCRPGQKTVYSGGRQETIKILCELEANPHNVTFNWKFNASSTEFLDLPASQIFPERTNAVAQYTPMTEHVSKERVLIQSACYHSVLLFLFFSSTRSLQIIAQNSMDRKNFYIVAKVIWMKLWKEKSNYLSI